MPIPDDISKDARAGLARLDVFLEQARTSKRPVADLRQVVRLIDFEQERVMKSERPDPSVLDTRKLETARLFAKIGDLDNSHAMLEKISDPQVQLEGWKERYAMADPVAYQRMMGLAIDSDDPVSQEQMLVSIEGAARKNDELNDAAKAENVRKKLAQN
jgi:hypothetical protein